MSYLVYPAVFDGNDLPALVPGLTVLATNPYLPARRKLTIASLARTNKAKVSSAFYDSKQLVVRVGISRTSRAAVEQSMDTLMGLIQGQEKDLLISQSGGTRKYTCTFSAANPAKDGGSYVELDLLFETSDHFGYDNTPTQLLQVDNFTSGQKTTQVTVDGSAPFQAPIITITYVSITSTASKAVTIGNNTTGQAVTITRVWSTNDVLIIDVGAQSVKVNGTEVAFTGALPEFSKGVGYVAYSDQFTARTLGMNGIYYKRWV